MKSAQLRASLRVLYCTLSRSCTIELFNNIDGRFSVSCSIATLRASFLGVVCLSQLLQSLQSSC